jgi:dephospho-CoA kinase
MIIGICGFQSSGKDTIANLLINEYGFKKLSFAGALKDVLSVIFGWSREKLEGVTKEDREWREQIDIWWSKSLNMPQLSPRYALQYFGTELFRNHWHQDIWVKVVENKLINMIKEKEKEKVIITDCRFENEINLIRVYGGTIINVYRNMPQWFTEYKNGKYVEEVQLLHRSETEWIRCQSDTIIENNGTIEELYTKVKNLTNINN